MVAPLLCQPRRQWFVDRSSRPRTSPTRTSAGIEDRVLKIRRTHKLGPARIAGRLGLVVSTVHRILVRHGVNRLAWMDRPTGETIRRYEHDEPGDMVHLDVKKLAKVPS